MRFKILSATVSSVARSTLVLLGLLSFLGCSSEPKQQGADFESEEIVRKNPVFEPSRILLGNASAPVTVIEFGDFQCPACAVGAAAVKAVHAKHPDKIKFIYKHLPLDYHSQARPAAQAFEVLLAKDVAQAYEFYSLAFETPGKIKTQKDLDGLLKKFKLTAKSVQASVKKLKITETLAKDRREFIEFGFRGTPVFLINGQVLEGAPSPEDLEKVVLSNL